MGKRFVNISINRKLIKEVLLNLLPPPEGKTPEEVEEVINGAAEQLYNSMDITEDLNRKVVIMCFSELTQAINPEGLEQAYQEVLEKRLEEDKKEVVEAEVKGKNED